MKPLSIGSNSIRDYFARHPGRSVPLAKSNEMFLSKDGMYIRDTPISRNSDPAPSHDAERHLRQSGKLSKQQAEVLWWIKSFPGHTSRELQEMSAWTQELFHRRAVELCRAGLIVRGEPRRCKIGNRLAATWSLKEPKP